MFLTIFISVIVTLWILFCVGLFTFHYIIEVVLDLPITGQSPCTAHAALKQLIERLLREVVNLPSLQKAQEQPAVPSDENNRTYEDLLATAIINKVITSCQNNLPSSSAASVSSRVSNSSRNRDDKEYFFGEETIENKWKTTDLDSSSISSLEEWLQSDSSFGSKKYVDRVTLTIKQDIEEVSQTESEDEQEVDDGEYFRNSLQNEDESNWFLQKKQFQGTHSPVPVPMLVPNPTTEAKVLIGDQEVDDTSDLSDVASDYGDPEPIPGRQSLLVESKMIIGGKNPFQNGESESESSADSGVKEVDNQDRSVYDGPIFLPKTDITVDDDNVEDASILSVYSNTEKEAEYTERYGSLPRTIVKTPTPPSRPSLQKPKLPESTNEEEFENKEIRKPAVVGKEDENETEEEFPGSYSKREKEKWKYAIEMKNNPYSKENIEKRIKRSNSAASSLFGPDYYARQASSPSGGKVNLTEAKEAVWPPPEPREEEGLHKAIPVFVSQDEEGPISPEITYQTPSVIEVAELASSELTSDSDLSYVNFYDVENSQIYKRTKNSEQVTLIEAKILPEEPVINMPSVEVEKSDLNGNLTSEKDKHPNVESTEAVSQETPSANERKIISKGKVEDRPNFVKATPAVRQRTLPQKEDLRTLKRFKSETDLLEDSFDKPPTVISKKRDNTLISKIYLDPNVRNFRRSQLPVEDVEVSKPPLRNQHSMDATLLAHATNNNVRQPSYNSDDGLSSNYIRKKSYYSSEEDLSSNHSAVNESIPAFKGFQNPNVRSNRLHSRPSVSSEDGLLSDSSVSLDKPRPKSTRSLIYSSSEDLLSIDETEKLPKKKDNTLISKIYQDPNVRNFALTNRDYIPVDEDVIPKSPRYLSSSTDDLLSDHSVRHFRDTERNLLKPHVSNGTSMTPGISLDSLKIEEIPSTPKATHSMREEITYERKMTTPDPDINELAKKKIVHNILGQLTKSQPNLAGGSRLEIPRERKMSTDSEEISISVKDLKKKFENNDAKSKVVSSLTARSLSKQMRETLRN